MCAYMHAEMFTRLQMNSAHFTPPLHMYVCVLQRHVYPREAGYKGIYILPNMSFVQRQR